MVNEGANVLDTCTTLIGLPDLASDSSPLFAQPMFLFGCALCNTSTYCMLTLKKVKLVYRKSLQSIILLDFLERTERKLQSFD